jgi:hypothetical protein
MYLKLLFPVIEVAWVIMAGGVFYKINTETGGEYLLTLGVAYYVLLRDAFRNFSKPIE